MKGHICDWLPDRQRYNVRSDNGEVCVCLCPWSATGSHTHSSHHLQVIAVRASNLSEVETIVKEESFWVHTLPCLLSSSSPTPPFRTTQPKEKSSSLRVSWQRSAFWVRPYRHYHYWLNALSVCPAGATVEFQWLNGRSDLNGQKAVVDTFLEDRGRYNVKIAASGEMIAVKPGNIKTIAPYTHHYLKKHQEEQERMQKEWASVKAGDMISVKHDVMTDCKEPVKVPKGTRGTVVRMDKDGDACIKFDGIKDRRWIHKEKFSKSINVRMSADAPKSPLKPSTATNKSAAKEVPQKGRTNTGRGGLRVDLS